MITNIRVLAALLLFAATGIVGQADAANMTAAEVAACVRALHIDVNGDKPKSSASGQVDRGCQSQTKNSLPVPDPKCTPGGANPTLTLDVLKNPKFKTGCVRDQATSAQEKNKTYGWYNIPKPEHNTGATQICELDHLVSLELGGADTLDNIWPQCGPDGAQGLKRFFKQKDRVEDYLAARVRAGTIELDKAQAGIAEDWTQYLDAANEWAAAKATHKAKMPKRVRRRTH